MIQPGEIMKYRAFLAIYPSSEVQKLLGKVIQEFKKSSLPVRWVEKQNLHLTLKFFGMQSDERIYDIEQALEGALSDAQPFNLNMNGVSIFPDRSPRIISADLDSSPELISLKSKIDASLAVLPFVQKDRRSFLTHLTLGRITSPITEEKAKELTNFTLNGSWEVASMHLMESDLSGTSPEYSVMQSFQL
jgi:RNA 2',3'-cyclic 3'-phosphodiesterase